MHPRRVNAMPEVPGDDVPGAGGGTADRVGGGAVEQNAIAPVAEGIPAVGRRADQVALNERLLGGGVDLEAVEVARDHVAGPAVRSADDVPGRAVDEDAVAGIGEGRGPVGRGADEIPEDDIAGRVLVLAVEPDLDPVGRVARDEVALAGQHSADRVRR